MSCHVLSLRATQWRNRLNHMPLHLLRRVSHYLHSQSTWGNVGCETGMNLENAMYVIRFLPFDWSRWTETRVILASRGLPALLPAVWAIRAFWLALHCSDKPEEEVRPSPSGLQEPWIIETYRSHCYWILKVDIKSLVFTFMFVDSISQISPNPLLQSMN